MAGILWPSAAPREHQRGPSKPWRRLTWWTWLLVIGLCCCCTDTVSAQETEGRGGANAGGPSGQPSTAHLSDAERQQLLQVHQSILQSPDPQQALVQVAEANEMSPQQLAELLNQNAIDAQQQGGPTGAGGAGGGGGGTTFQGGWPKAAGKAFTSLWLVVVQYAKTNPKAFGVACTAALLVLYTMVTAPRTGLVLSSGHGLLSRGHTTLFTPPTKYVQRYLDSPSVGRRPVSPALSSSRTSRGDHNQWIDELEDEMNDPPKRADQVALSAQSSVSVLWHRKFRKSTIKEAATARVKLQLEHFLPDDEEVDSDESIGEDTEPIGRSTKSKGSTRSAAPPPPPPAPKDADNNAAMVRDLLWDAVLNVVSGRRFTDFAADTGIRFQSSQRQALLVLPGSGDWRRYGMIPFRATQSHESDGRAEAVFTTLRGALLEGYLRVCVRQSRGSVDIGVDLVIPKRCRRVSKRLATLTVGTLAASIARSVESECRSKLARQGQNARFQRSAHQRATERRRFRSKKAQELEEMAADRRRRRSNPNAGRYRPSGHRMQSPKNAMY